MMHYEEFNCRTSQHRIPCLNARPEESDWLVTDSCCTAEEAPLTIKLL